MRELAPEELVERTRQRTKPEGERGVARLSEPPLGGDIGAKKQVCVADESSMAEFHGHAPEAAPLLCPCTRTVVEAVNCWDARSPVSWCRREWGTLLFCCSQGQGASASCILGGARKTARMGEWLPRGPLRHRGEHMRHQPLLGGWGGRGGCCGAAAAQMLPVLTSLVSH